MNRISRVRRQIFFWTFCVVLALSAACRPEAPAADPDPERALFAPFDFKDLQGETRRVEEYQDAVTLVNFFFPT